MRVRSLLAVLLFIGGLALPTPSSAQGTADIVGRVTDTSDAVLPGASITVTNTGTNAVRSTVTTESGDYVFTLLPIGSYTVAIELQGFQTQTTKITLTTGDRIRLDGRLSVGALSESLVVTGESPLLQTDTSTLSTLVSEQAVQDLPVNGRNFIRLVQLVPGATEGFSNAINSGNRPDDRRSTSAVSINGAPDNLNNQMIDGMDNNERSIGTVLVKPSMDAIAEVRVQTNLYSAEVGRTAGGVINILTKSGTNAFHGSVYDFIRNDRFDERNYFAKEDPVMEQHQFGGSLGGPIVSNRTFFFSDYEGLRGTNGIVSNLTIATTKMRAGDFSELLPARQIFDPATSPRVQFPGNIIPTNRLDPVALNYMSLLPAPTNGDVANNFQHTSISTQHSHVADGRVDHRFNSDNSIFARYSYNRLDYVRPGGCDPASTGPWAGYSVVCRGSEVGSSGTNQTVAGALHMNYVRVFSPTLIGEFKGGYSHFDLESLPLNYLTNISEKFGMPNVNLPDPANGGGLATVTINGYTALGDAQFLPIITDANTKQVAVSLTKTMGAHSLKVGGGVVFRMFGVLQSGAPIGVFTFGTTLTRSSANAGGDGMASFLLGYPTNIQRRQSPFQPANFTNEPSVFVQDDWRATSWLTVNLGLRYDVYTPFTEEENRMANMDVYASAPVVLVAGANGVSESVNIKTDYSNVSPRLGFAATLPRRMVLRGGYGLSFYPGNIASGAYLRNPPINVTYGPVISAGDTGGAPTLFLKNGLPPESSTAPSVEPQFLSGSFGASSVNFKSTLVHQFNAQLEKEFVGNLVTAGYVGARSDRVIGSYNLSLAPAGAGPVQPRRRTAGRFPLLNSLTNSQTDLTNSYDAAQVSFQRRFTSGFSVTTHYRWSNAMTDRRATWDSSIIERASDQQDIETSWVLQASYALPWGQSLTGVAKGFLAGWQINAVANWQGGIPFDVQNSTALSNTGGNDRPNLIGDPELPEDERTVERWFNTSAFQAQPAFTVGDTPPTILHGPSQRRLDLSFFKDLALGPTTLQLRYEIYNVTNTANFQPPTILNSTQAAFGSADFGRLTSTGNATPRQMQFAFKLLF